MKLPELLAPAGSPDALKAAVSAGADAVYLSGKRFGARKYAANFDQEELKGAVDYAHLHNVKVYVTVNTLIKDDELPDVARYLLWLYEIGVDAVLVQDVGVAALAHQIVPELALHASTQMTIHNESGASWAERLGMKRAVLAREVSLEEAEEIARGSRIGLEAFVHGALCYSYSGQCLLSSVIGGRSGNRGMCAQPCRKPYVLLCGDLDEYGRPVNLGAVPVKERFLISTRDLSVYAQLDRIVRTQIQSLKIEGRMKSPEYVAIVTSIYRKALDAIAKGGWSPSSKDQRDLALAFNRDFTGGYLTGSGEIMGREMSDNRGFFIGTVASYDPKNGDVTVRLDGPLSAEQGDGLVFQSPGQELGMTVRRLPLCKDGMMRLRPPERVKPGAKVYITSSIMLNRQAEKIVSRTGPKIPLDLAVSWDEGVPVAECWLVGPKGPLKVHVRAGFKMEKALGRPLTEEQIEAQLKKTGGTPFSVRKMKMDYPGGLFVPIGLLNQLRRDVLTKAEAALLAAHRPDEENINAARERLSKIDLTARTGRNKTDESLIAPSLAVYADSLEAILGAIEGGCNRIYFEPRLGGSSPKGSSQKERFEELTDLLKMAKDLCQDAELIWKWPKITKDGYIKSAVSLLTQLDFDGTVEDGVMVEGMGVAEALSAEFPKIPLSGSSGLNIWNHISLRAHSPPFRRLTLPAELSSDQLTNLVAKSRLIGGSPKLELMVQGNLEVMVSEDCLTRAAANIVRCSKGFLGLQDFKRVFPLWIDDDKRTHILNAAETCLVNYMPKLFEMGLDGIAIDARCRTGKYAKDMAKIYMKAIALTIKGNGNLERDLESLKEKARAISLGGMTAGHFVKGLKDELPNLG